jgi:ferritin-like metal-binding protein YciE
MTTFNTIENLLEDQLKDIYSAESQLTKALPKLARAVSNATLQKALTAHLQETQGQVVRLEKIAEKMKINLIGKKCKAMEGLVAECAEAMEAGGDEYLIDAGIVAAAHRVEHYEMSAYESAIALSEKAGLEDVAKLLRDSHKEEINASEKLCTICNEELFTSFEEADESEEQDEDEDEESSPTKPSRISNRNSTGSIWSSKARS